MYERWRGQAWWLRVGGVGVIALVVASMVVLGSVAGHRRLASSSGRPSPSDLRAATVGARVATPASPATTGPANTVPATTIEPPPASVAPGSGSPIPPARSTAAAGHGVPVTSAILPTTTLPRTSLPSGPPPVPPTLPPQTTPPAIPTPDATGTWSSVTNGITTWLRIDPPAPRVGDVVHFYLTASDQNQWCCLTAFYPGDGSSVLPTMDHPCPAPRPSTYTKQIDHVYRQAGTFSVEVQPSAASMCTGMPVIINATLFVPLTVAPAA